jgi:ABC-type proline/glycine betaine transport system ATPase subunit
MLLGEKNCGKTTTLNLVYDCLNQQQAGIIEKKESINEMKDFECIIRYKSKKIAFFTMGDFAIRLIKAFEKYADKQCDVLVCACNTKLKLPHWHIKKHPNAIVKKTMPLCCYSNSIDTYKILQLL